MLKGRAVTIKFEKPKPEDDSEIDEDKRSFEETADMYLSFFERVALRVAMGVAGYVLLDTYRRVKVAKAQQLNQ